MSAFIVDNPTINRVVTYIRGELNAHDYTPIQKLAIQYEVDLLSEGWETALATLMLELNERGMHARYGDMLTFRVVAFEPEYTHSRVQVFKSLMCFLYQCSEGDVVQMPLYRFFEDVKHMLAVDIVRDLPAYDKAEWA